MAIQYVDGRVEFVGQVVAVREFRSCREERLCAIIANLDGSYAEETVGSASRMSDYWAYSDNNPIAKVDATPEMIATYETKQKAYAAAEAAERAAEDAMLEAKRRANREAAEAKRIRKGDAVEVYKGRKVRVGTKGVCIWVGVGHYGERVGVKDAAGTAHWTAIDNVRKIVA